MIELFFLGTGASIPSNERGHTTIALRHTGEIFLLDCGEGTQRAMVIAGLSMMKVSKILLTHFHADHYAGLIPLVQSLSLLGRRAKLEVYGPKGIKEMAKHLKPLIGDTGYELEFKEARKVDGGNYIISSIRTSHGIPACAYSFEEKTHPLFLEDKAKKLGVFGLDRKQLQEGKSVKIGNRTIRPKDVLGGKKEGKKVVYSGDTAPLKSMAKFAKGADILIHEPTFGDDKEKEAKEYKHSTARQAAGIAKAAGAKRLILTHISPRYKKAEELEKQAKEVFEDSEISKDLMTVTI